VYAGGYVNNDKDNSVATLWKDGVPQSLLSSSEEAWIKGIAVRGQ
jgi:hypothetical protein